MMVESHDDVDYISGEFDFVSCICIERACETRMVCLGVTLEDFPWHQLRDMIDRDTLLRLWPTQDCRWCIHRYPCHHDYTSCDHEVQVCHFA